MRAKGEGGERLPYNHSSYASYVGRGMTPSETLTLATYFFVLVILAVYGWHRYYLVYLYMKNKDKMPVPAGPTSTSTTRPAVTIWTAAGR